MRATTWKLLTSLSLIIFLSSCEKEELVKEVSVHPDLEVYWQSFLTEAENRGIDLQVDTLNFVMDFAQLDSVGLTTAGKCYGVPGGDILIDVDEWAAIDEVTKESLIFHELGHCVLGRYHTNPYGERDGNIRDFTCSSLMTPCLCGFGCGLDLHSTQWRTFYLDELFGISTAPIWLNNGVVYETEMFDEILASITDAMASEVSLSDISCGNTNNYQVEVDIAGHRSFSLEVGGLRYEFNSFNGQVGIFQDEILVFDLSSITNWAQLNDDWGGTTFTYRHLDGIDYLYLKETLIHSREGSGACDPLRISFEDEELFSVLVTGRS